MRTHIMIVLTALIATACASHQRDIASTRDNYNNQDESVQQAMRMDTGASAKGGGSSFR